MKTNEKNFDNKRLNEIKDRILDETQSINIYELKIILCGIIRKTNVKY